LAVAVETGVAILQRSAVTARPLEFRAAGVHRQNDVYAAASPYSPSASSDLGPLGVIECRLLN